MKAEEEQALRTEPPDSDPGRQRVDRALRRYGYRQDALIELLHIAQSELGYLSPAVLTHIARALKLPLSWVFGVASFYHYFSFGEAPAHSCVVCTGTACHVEGAPAIIAALRREWGVTLNEQNGAAPFALLDFRCPGSCGVAPVVVLDGRMIGRATPQGVINAVSAVLAAPMPEEATS